MGDRLAWPLRKDDTLSTRNGPTFFFFFFLSSLNRYEAALPKCQPQYDALLPSIDEFCMNCAIFIGLYGRWVATLGIAARHCHDHRASTYWCSRWTIWDWINQLESCVIAMAASASASTCVEQAIERKVDLTCNRHWETQRRRKTPIVELSTVIAYPVVNMSSAMPW